MDTQRTAAFLHAHLDDEAVFTGGTGPCWLNRATGQCHQVVLLVATSGELGVPEDDVSDLALAREDEARSCCASFGVGLWL